MQYGSVINQFMVGPDVTPEVGMGVTFVQWSDRHACTVIAIDADSITIQRDIAIRTDDHGMSDSQSYRFERDPNGSVRKFRKIKRGQHKGKYAYPINYPGEKTELVKLWFGVRDEYYDYSF